MNTHLAQDHAQKRLKSKSKHLMQPMHAATMNPANNTASGEPAKHAAADLTDQQPAPQKRSSTAIKLSIRPLKPKQAEQVGQVQANSNDAVRKRLQTHPSRITGLLPSGTINIDRTNRIQLLPEADTNVDMTAPGSDAEDQRRKAAAARYRRSLQLLAKGTAHHAAGPAQALKAKLAQQRNIARMSDDIPTEGNVLSARFDRASDSPERLPSKPQSPLDGLEALCSGQGLHACPKHASALCKLPLPWSVSLPHLHIYLYPTLVCF